MSKQSTTSRLLAYALVYKFRIIGSMLILCCAVGAELGGPFITKTIIDKHLTNGDQELARGAYAAGLVSGTSPCREHR